MRGEPEVFLASVVVPAVVIVALFSVSRVVVVVVVATAPIASSASSFRSARDPRARSTFPRDASPQSTRARSTERPHDRTTPIVASRHRVTRENRSIE